MGRCKELCEQLEPRQLEAAARCRSHTEPRSPSSGEARRWHGGRKGRKRRGRGRKRRAPGRQGDKQHPDGLREGAGGSRRGRSAAGGRAMLEPLFVLLLVKWNKK